MPSLTFTAHWAGLAAACNVCRRPRRRDGRGTPGGTGALAFVISPIADNLATALLLGAGFFPLVLPSLVTWLVPALILSLAVRVTDVDAGSAARIGVWRADGNSCSTRSFARNPPRWRTRGLRCHSMRLPCWNVSSGTRCCSFAARSWLLAGWADGERRSRVGLRLGGRPLDSSRPPSRAGGAQPF
jgi:hypothetical protein